MRGAICVLTNDHGEVRGLVNMFTSSNGVQFVVKLWNVSPGNHGFHVHRTGDISQGAHSLCDHFSSPGKMHGGRNDPNGHEGDLGNLTVKEDGGCEVSFLAKYLSLDGDVSQTIIGRSLVVHDHEDDLGLGSFADSKTSGHSGDRMLYGIIGVDESCEERHVPRPDDGECLLM